MKEKLFRMALAVFTGLVIIVGAIFSAGCNPIAYVDAPFIAYNEGPRAIAVSVNDSPEVTVAPNSRSPQFGAAIPIARNPVGSGVGPSIVDKSTQVKVFVRELSGNHSVSQLCYAAPKQVTYIQYVSRNDYSYIQCPGSGW